MKKLLLVTLAVLAISASAFAGGEKLAEEGIMVAVRAAEEAGVDLGAAKGIAAVGRAEALSAMLASGKLTSTQAAAVLGAVQAKLGTKVTLDEVKASLTSYIAEAKNAQAGATSMGNANTGAQEALDNAAAQGPNVAARLTDAQETTLMSSAKDVSDATGVEVLGAEQVACLNNETLSEEAIGNFVTYNKEASAEVVNEVAQGQEVAAEQVGNVYINTYGAVTKRLGTEAKAGFCYVAQKCGGTGFHSAQLAQAAGCNN